jgi:lysozyme
MGAVMKTLVLKSIIVCLSVSTAFGQTQSDVEFLRARADAHERKITQLEQDLSRLKALLAEKPATAMAANPKQTAKVLAVAATEPVANSYVVKHGDVLSRIATSHQTSVAAILKENDLPNDRIIVGQKLRIPGVAAPATSSTQEVAAPAAKNLAKYQVKSGETFYSIARIHNVSMKSLQAANPEVVPTKMYVGQTLRIDGSATASASNAVQNTKKSQKSSASAAPKRTELASQKKTPVKQPAPSASTAGAEPTIRTITVDQQITYGQFATRHGSNTTQLNELNGLSLNKNTTLAKGSELYVPTF